MPSPVPDSAEIVGAGAPSSGFVSKDVRIVPPRWLARLLVVTGSIGLLCACVLLVEKISVLEDPSYVPSCSINPVLSCGSVMTSDQAEAFGFPNPLLGVIGFSVVIAIGVAVLAGASMRGWFWWGLEAGALFGIGFVHWLIFQSLYRIGALCPYCMVVWAATIPLFWYVTLWNLRRVGPVGPVGPEELRRAIDTIWTFHAPILTAWFLVIGGAITVRFWDYWSTLL